jgi:hypothetical protein
MTEAQDKEAAPRVATHRSKGVVERNLPRWFRGRNFKAWDDFVAFVSSDPGVKADADLAKDQAELSSKGDEASPKGLQRLVKHYNKKRKFKKDELAPPWLFVEGTSASLPADDSWTIETAVELDKTHEKEKSERPKNAPAPASTGPALADGGSYVSPPASDKQWAEALRRLPPAARLLCDGRGVSPAELNERRRLAIKLNDFDRELSRDRSVHQDVRRSLLEWAAQNKAKDIGAVRAESKRRDDEQKSWIDAQAARAAVKHPNMDEGTRAELSARLKREHPNVPDEARLEILVRAAVSASNPKRREAWAKKVIDDWNASRGSMFERVRDQRVIQQIVQWLVSRDEEETPTDGEIYDQLEKFGIRTAVKKRRNEGPRRPKEPERKRDRHPNEDEPEEPKAKSAKGAKGAAPAAAATAEGAKPAADAPAADKPAEAPPAESPPADKPSA